MSAPSAGHLEGGFALVSVLITLIALTALAVGGFTIANTDLRISDNHMAASRAFQTADAALQEHLGTNRRGSNTVSYSYSSGAATVAGTQLIDLGDGSTLHSIVSQATHQAPGGGTASRTVGVVAMMHDGTFRANAAITAGSGLAKDGTSGTIDGNDQASASDCTAGAQPAVAGVATGPGGYTQNGVGNGNGGGGGTVPDGNPPIDDSQSGLQQLSDLGIDWSGILSGSVVTPDFTIPGDSWPNFGSLDPDWWPVTFVDQTSASLDPSHSGRGTLIVKGDLILNGSFRWDGIVLVGGALTSDGNQTVKGTAIAALNMLLGQSVGQSTFAHGTKTFTFHSCWVRAAAQQFAGGLVQIPGTWSEGM